jgi:hypothetical protein
VRLWASLSEGNAALSFAVADLAPQIRQEALDGRWARGWGRL